MNLLLASDLFRVWSCCVGGRSLVWPSAPAARTAGTGARAPEPPAPLPCPCSANLRGIRQGVPLYGGLRCQSPRQAAGRNSPPEAIGIPSRGLDLVLTGSRGLDLVLTGFSNASATVRTCCWRGRVTFHIIQPLGVGPAWRRQGFHR
jgi:hypothetical protein